MKLDIEAIKKRHLRYEQMEHRTFYEGHIAIDLSSCVDEIEHLRQEKEAIVKWLHTCGLARLADSVESGAFAPKEKP